MELPVEISQIPILSSVFMKIVQFDPSSPDASVTDLETIAAPDKGVSTSLMKVANSSFYGRSGSIDTLRGAITLLGFKTVRNFVILLNAKQVTANTKNETARRYLHELPLLTALLAMDFSRPLGVKGKENIFLASLFHPLGMNILALNFPKEYLNILQTRETMLAAEKEAFQADHRVFSRYILEKWNMPKELIEVADGYLLDNAGLMQQSELVRVVGIASYVVRRFLKIDNLPKNEKLIEVALKLHGKDLSFLDVASDEKLETLRFHPMYESGMSV